MRLTLVCLFLAFAVTCAYAQQLSQKQPSPKPSPSPAEVTQPKAEQPQPRPQQIAPERGSEQAPFVIQLIPPPGAPVAKETKTQEKTSLTDWLLVLFSGLLFGCILLLALIARSQRNDLRAIQRAYVSAEPEGIHPLWGDTRDDHWVIGHVKFRNGGHMLARNFRWYATIACDENSSREDFPIPSESEFEGTTMIAPGSAMKFGTGEVKLPPTGWIYVWGAYTYHNGFDQNPPAKFCHRYNRSALRKDIDKSDPENGYGIPADDGRLHRFGNTEKRDEGTSEPSRPQTPSETTST
jgi:hypothetical protein